MLQNATLLRKSALTSLLVPRLPGKMHLCSSFSNVPRLPTLLKLLQTLTLCSLLTRCRIFCTGRAKRHLNVQKCSEHVVFCTFWLGNVLRATTAFTFSTSQISKVLRTWCALRILTWKRASRHNNNAFSTSQFPKLFWARQFFTLFTSKCASRHNGVQFFDISTSRSAPSTVCFVRFDFDMCFALRRRAIFHFSSGQIAPRPPL